MIISNDNRIGDLCGSRWGCDGGVSDNIKYECWFDYFFCYFGL